MFAISPTGSLIVATLERIEASEAGLSLDGFDRNPDGSISYDHAGETDVNWDGQETVTRDGQTVFVDDDHTEWLESEITLIEDEEPTEIELVEAARKGDPLKHRALAESEGWGLFESDSDGMLVLEVDADTAPAKPGSRGMTNEDVHALVQAKADAGSAYHKRALALHGTFPNHKTITVVFRDEGRPLIYTVRVPAIDDGTDEDIRESVRDAVIEHRIADIGTGDPEEDENLRNMYREGMLEIDFAFVGDLTPVADWRT